MAIFEKMFTKKEEIDIDDFLNNMDVEEEPEEIDFYVKPINLQSNVEIEMTIRELAQKNIVILDIDGISKRNPQKAKQFISQLKIYIDDKGGDLAMMSKTKLLLVPEKVKIIKKINK
ncbi:MAG: cell division protein SepF [Candidatus ainarchaeum sp.]|nr:cell division protein SepF [Candidatus ainarchaeum sp.]MDD3976346.1 cell division protein SepF [Candidatus ainarchaeum sp.]